MTAEDLGNEGSIDVWGENWDAVTLFISLSTQWRHGFSGPTGLDYAVVQPTIAMMGFAPENHSELFSKLRVLERSALDKFAEEQSRGSRK